MYLHLFSKKIGDYYFVFEESGNKDNTSYYHVRCLNNFFYKPFYMNQKTQSQWHISNKDSVHYELLLLEREFSEAIRKENDTGNK